MKTENLQNRKDLVNSPFRYPGNQIYALDTLLSLIPEHKYYAEPFCGGASTFFGKPKVEGNWLNDIDSELIDTYIAIRDQPEELAAVLTGEEVSEHRYSHFKIELTPKNAFETAVRWFYLNRTSRLETMSMHWERDKEVYSTPVNWSNIIFECSKKLQGIKLTSGDFENVLDKIPEGAFLFIAPPYSIHHSPSQNKLHKYPFEREAHFRLANTLKNKNLKFMLTYNENKEIRKIYSWGEHITIINLPNKPPQKEEIVIMNYSKM